MPSLANLEQFKQDIRSLAHEPSVREERGEVFDDIPLPSDEAPAAVNQPLDDDLAALLGLTDQNTDTDTVSPVDGTNDSGLQNSAEQDYDVDAFANLLDTLPLGGDTADNTAQPADIAAEQSVTPTPDADDPFSIPDGLLTGLADSLDVANASAPDFTTSDIPPAPDADFSIPSSTDADIPSFNESAAPDVDFSVPDADFSIPSSTDADALADIPSFDESAAPDVDFSVPDTDFSVPDAADTAAVEPLPKQNKAPWDKNELPSIIPSSFTDGGTGISGGVDLTPDVEDIPAQAAEDDNKNPSGETDDTQLFDTDNAVTAEDSDEPLNAADDDAFNLTIEDLPDIPTDSEHDIAAPEPALQDFDLPDFDSTPDSTEQAAEPAAIDEFEMPEFSNLDAPGNISSLTGTADNDFPDISNDVQLPDVDTVEDISADISNADALPADTSFDMPEFSDAANLAPPTAEEEAAFMADNSAPADINDIAAGFSSGDDDNFAQFSLDSDFVNESFNFSENGLNDADSGEFSFEGVPGFDDAFSNAKPQKKQETSSAAASFSLSEKDFDTFMNVLTTYPLNLRIALEDLIVNAVLPENQIQDIVNRIIGGTQPRAIASEIGDIIGKTIEIPKDFEKHSADTREEELNSFGYILRYKLLPALAVGTLGLLMLACVSFLSYEFIYRPIRAHSYYKEGYACIEDSRYAESVSLFNKALSYNEKKDWHYRYASAYAEHKQYQLAENIYERMLFRYPKDKQPALVYARMESEELRNFVKAEAIVRRSVLDNFVNDKDGMLLLGDIFMEWGTEDYTKYAEGGEIYDMLIEMYGTKDVYLSRKLRYNIRTDNLAEVLPLKDHFMQEKHVLEANDQIELGGYLLKKRYQPQGGNDDYLRALIEDVRECLDKGLEKGPDIPEAYYNMGQYFVHTGNDNAKNMFIRAVELYDTVPVMSPMRVERNIDACRLLGESYIKSRESIAAAEVYNKGMQIYESAVQKRTIKRSAYGGELYADIADIDYFLTGKLDDAALFYQYAADNFYDTPDVRYKLGFIHYSNEQYEDALNSFVRTAAALPEDENTMFAMANALFKRKNYAAAQGYYTRLLNKLENTKTRLGILFPQVRSDHGEFVQQYMETANNLAVTLYKLGQRTGDAYKQGESGVLLTQALRAYDALTRNPDTLVRLSGGNLPELNIKYTRYPVSSFEPGIYTNIPQLPDNTQPFKKH